MRIKSDAIAFAIGIPIWVVTSFLLDLLSRATMGITGAGGQSGNIPLTLTSAPSMFILAYFGFSSLALTFFPNTKRRLFLSVAVHLLLVASIFSVSQVHAGTGRAISRILILMLIYVVYFSPWLISWRNFIKIGQIQDSPVKSTSVLKEQSLPDESGGSVPKRRSKQWLKSKY